MSLTLEKFDVACSLVTYGGRYGLNDVHQFYFEKSVSTHE